MKSSITFIIVILIVLLSNLKAIAQKEHKPIDYSNWASVSAFNLSKDNNWLLLTKRTGSSLNQVSTLSINTKSKKVKELEYQTNQLDALLDNNIIIAKQENRLYLNDLENDRNNIYIDSISQYTSIPSKNQILVLDKNRNLSLIQINKNLNNNKVLATAKHVSKYSINTKLNKLVYQVENPVEHGYFYLNIETLKLEKLSSQAQDLSYMIWNNQQDSYITKSDNSSLLFVELSTNKTRTIQLEHNKQDRLKIEFFSNDDLYIEYNIITDKTYPETTYLDIWNSNTKALYPNNFKLKHEILHKAFIYHYNQNKLQALERKRDKLYIHIGVPNYILTYNPAEHEDFQSNKTYQFSVYNINTNTVETILPPISGYTLLRPSKDNKNILYRTKENGIWNIYNFETKSTISFESTSNWLVNVWPKWSDDSKKVYFQQGNNLHRINICTQETEQLSYFQSKDNRINLVSSYNYSKTNQYYDDSKPILFLNSSPTENSFFTLEKDKIEILYTTSNLIKLKEGTSDLANYMSIFFTEENFKSPPIVKTLINNKVNTLYSKYIPEELYNWREVKKFNFKDKFDKTVDGFLTYPKDFDAKKKYPLIIELYDNFGTLDKNFMEIETKNDASLNLSYYNEKGYFVCKLNTYVSQEGPGIAALDITLKGLERVLSLESAIDANNVGLFGFSFGGYKSSFIATQTDRFKTIVSGGASHDLIGGQTYRYSHYRKLPDWLMSEKSQMQLQDTYKDNPTKYIANSPLLHAQNVKTPMLLYAGLKDNNVPSENTSKMFIALLRYKKPAIALFYKNVEHGITRAEKTESKDFEQRLLDWFNYHLKDQREIKWINDGLDNTKYTFSKLDNF
ncbi:prolyl oligopeptidase family serine peptidase [Myroides marinus]|uniref:S9 family peptidase n=1 Tax=Myroides marinus TaxID=703342 RepID=UPI00074232F8|nr:prolyl oligopeptidase family serine peptidase [Myroides marinus]KUF46027.1 hypothetical protein AS361_07930 [Myroides marinus]MDM1348841.1 prolyl oligopeptidase family serine peptidase [Myroides marinus]MDM1352526.1 prolyl oligopeptidase family serine peptidase [Myroides marinus]MDM1359731.1 prolyl oligopeptidase family serine peptidase [Myroides marinus]MDM1363264.1 prolyl oligopeptidase family serine peptidase [Myroides marinus]